MFSLPLLHLVAAAAGGLLAATLVLTGAAYGVTAIRGADVTRRASDAAPGRARRPCARDRRGHAVARPLRPLVRDERLRHRRRRDRRGGAASPRGSDRGIDGRRRGRRGRARGAPPGSVHASRRHRGWSVVPGTPRGGRRAPGGVPEARRGAQPELGGGSLHRQQHRHDPPLLRARHVDRPGRHGPVEPDGCRRRERSDDLQQRPAVGPSPAGRHARPAPDRAPVLHVHVGQHRPLPDQRAAHRGDALGAGDGPRQEPVEPGLDRIPRAVHPWLRPGDGAGERSRRERPAAADRAEPAGHVRAGGTGRDAAPHLLRAASVGLGACRRQEPGVRLSLEHRKRERRRHALRGKRGDQRGVAARAALLGLEPGRPQPRDQRPGDGADEAPAAPQPGRSPRHARPVPVARRGPVPGDRPERAPRLRPGRVHHHGRACPMRRR